MPARGEMWSDADGDWWSDIERGFQLWREIRRLENLGDLTTRQRVLWRIFSYRNNVGIGWNVTVPLQNVENGMTCWPGREGVVFYHDVPNEDGTLNRLLTPIHFGPMPHRFSDSATGNDWQTLFRLMEAGTSGGATRNQNDILERISRATGGRAVNRRGPISPLPNDAHRWRARRFRIVGYRILRTSQTSLRNFGRPLALLILLNYGDAIITDLLDGLGVDWRGCDGPCIGPMTDDQWGDFRVLVNETNRNNDSCANAQPLQIGFTYSNLKAPFLSIYKFSSAAIAAGNVSAADLLRCQRWYRYVPTTTNDGEWPYKFCLNITSPNSTNEVGQTVYANVKVYCGACSPAELTSFSLQGDQAESLTLLHNDGTPGRYTITMTVPPYLFVLVDSFVEDYPTMGDHMHYEFTLERSECTSPPTSCAEAQAIQHVSVYGPFTITSGDHWFALPFLVGGETCRMNITISALDGTAGLTIYEGVTCAGLSQVFAGSIGLGDSCATFTIDGEVLGNANFIKVALSTGTTMTYTFSINTGACS